MAYYFDNNCDGYINKKLLEELDELWLIKKSLLFQKFECFHEKHDNTNFETVIAYNRQDRIKSSKQKYTIDGYFFIPQSMDIQAKDYRAKSFFSSLTNHIRLKSPDFLPSSFLDLKKSDLPLGALIKIKKQMLENPQLNLEEEVLEKTKLAASYIKHALKYLNIQDHFSPSYNITRHYELEAELSGTLMKLFRSVVREYNEIFMHKIPQTVKSMNLIEEFLSYHLEEKWIKILKYGNRKKLDKLSEIVQRLLNEEAGYRKNFSYIKIDGLDAKEDELRDYDSIEREKESFIYRLGILKKFIQEQLYLNVKYKAMNQYMIHSVAMFAALLAAFFAYGMELCQRNIWGFDWSYNAGFIIAISSFSYVIKDRIKDLFKVLLLGRIGNNYDIKHDISLPGKHKLVFATTREKVRLTDKSRKNLPAGIFNLRDDGHIFTHERIKRETVIHYSKEIVIDWSLLESNLAPMLNEIKEIYRFNFKDFLVYMDDPNRKIRIYNPEKKQIQKLILPKVYHINVVFQISPWLSKKVIDHENVETFRVRLVVDKNGIKRVENVDKKLKSVYPLSTAEVSAHVNKDLDLSRNKFSPIDSSVVQLQG
ncbi:MAG: hypothetical protein A2381_18590 [Bdellovibrionales bacterium RIFOXYB1_FULL_37_110]|nr:MAG: hypothetical protein A2417_01180 [Bdellovibrionales bacterium RIFOXYC1_FULL_37_79]OFZ59038.1 MAG: hypothetical protein A2381_18590 [Bdellovibrionales bacterium RIFOXYB1_FULL_37_110]OFZ65143.1 MAG: hypothetical protein A2577_04905 [Bdellovibrionales bacterium RIFOXYD1_FULL_36_51]